MEIYLTKSTAILAIFWILYVSFLEKENMHRFKRFYLLASIIAAFCIPLLSITEYVYVTPLDGFQFTNEVIPAIVNETLPINEAAFWTLERILLGLYLTGVIVFSIRFLRNIFKMVKTISANEKQKQSSITYVLLQQLINPHTFFNFIFLNKSKFQKNEVPKEVILHEETHAKQRHSLDILFLEILQIVFWFQPFIWLYKRRIKLNHEFLADQAVIDKGVLPSTYQNTLLSYSSHQDYSLSNAINYSSIKKRFTVMKTQTSQKKKWLFSLLVLPILGLLFYSFSEREIVEIDKPAEEFSELIHSQNKANENEASEAQMKEYRNFISKYNETNTIYFESYERAIIIYDKLMSDEQRATVKKYPERMIPIPNLSKVQAKVPTTAEFEAYKNSKEYAIWIDNKHVSNSELNNYSVKDFVHVSGSYVFKNARSEKFPQPNQYHLYTKAGFKATNRDSQIKRYYKAAKKYTEAIQLYIKGSQTDNSELKILKTQADAIYQTFSEEEIKKNDIRQTPPVPAEYKKPRNTSQQNRPTPKEIAAYNNWAKKINEKSVEYSDGTKLLPIIIEKNLIKYAGIHNRMSAQQKQNAEKMPFTGYEYVKGTEKRISVDPPKEQQNLPTAKEIAAYNAWAKKTKAKFKTMPDSEKVNGYPHMINDETFRYHNSIYDRMSQTQKDNAESLPEAVLVTEWPMPKVIDVTPVQQKLPTAKEVAEYNSWAKKMSSQISRAKSNKNVDYPIIKQKDIQRYKSIYNRMSDKQKTNSEAWPNIPPPPPPPPTKPRTYKDGNNKTLDYIIKNTRKGAQSGYEVLDNGESHYYIIYKGKKTYYNKDGYVTDDKGNVLPPPPPPPPAPTNDKSKGGPNADYSIDNWNEDYTIRQIILRMSKSQTKPIVFKVDKTVITINAAENFIKKYNDADVLFQSGEVNVLTFTKKQDSKMTKDELQSIYSELYKTYSEKDTKTIYYRKVD